MRIVAWLVVFIHFGFNCLAQVIPADRLTDWTAPGSAPAFTITQSVNLLSFGADSSGNNPSDSALQQAIAALNGPGEVFIPKGTYKFSQLINLPDSIILQGEVDSIIMKPVTKLILSTGTNSHGISISGNETATNVFLNYQLQKGDTKIFVTNATIFAAGDYIRLKATDDTSFVNDNWALGTTGQIIKIVSVSGDTLYLDKPLRRSYPGNYPEIRKLNPRKQVHLKCMIIERTDITSLQTSNIFFYRAADCSVSGVESYYCNYAHVDINTSTNITIENSFFKDAHSYGSGGKAYGVMLEFTSGDCYIHQNNFEHLRHSIIFQAGSNGNVVAYNYSKDPYWTGTILPANSAGDLVFHGNYPYMNLLEGNVVQNIVIDNSHGINGPYNMFFRNRAELYGIFMNSSPASDGQSFIGNQVTNTSSSIMGLYSLQGNDHFEYGNQVKGTIMPAGTGEPADTTLFNYNFNTFYQYVSSVPPIRNANWQATTPLIAAQYQSQNLNLPAICSEYNYTGTLVHDVTSQNNLILYPNPFRDELNIISHSEITYYNIINLQGQLIKRGKLINNKLNLTDLNPGVYFMNLTGKENNSFKIIKINN